MKDEKHAAVVLGVGASKGLGAALCRKFAAEGHHVFVAGRTPQKVETVAQEITTAGGQATAVPCDATSEPDIVQLFDTIDRAAPGALDLAVYNAGNSVPGKIREMSAESFENAWRILCLGGFLFGREVTRRILPGQGTLLFTGASASLRGKAGFGAFNAGKSALRILAQAMAKEYAAEGLHVGHVIIDGGIAGQRQIDRLGRDFRDGEIKHFISLDGLADTYWQLYRQPESAWTFELDIRTSQENW